MNTPLNTLQAIVYLRENHNQHFRQTTLDTYRSKGNGPDFIKSGKKIFYLKEDLDTWIQERSNKVINLKKSK